MNGRVRAYPSRMFAPGVHPDPTRPRSVAAPCPQPAGPIPGHPRPRTRMGRRRVEMSYRSITRYEALRIVADAAHLPLLIFFALFFAAGDVGRWRSSRRASGESTWRRRCEGIVDGVLAERQRPKAWSKTTERRRVTSSKACSMACARAGGAAGAPGGGLSSPATDDDP